MSNNGRPGTPNGPHLIRTALRFMRKVGRQSHSAPQEVPSDRGDAVRRDSEYLLEHARWLFELHAGRTRSAQQRAAGVMAFAGGLLALAPTALRADPSGAQLGFFIATLSLAVGTIGLAMWSLLPRTTQGPGIPELRQLWAAHQKGGGPVDHVHQIAEAFLLSTRPWEDSVLDFARRDADVRTKRLKWGYATLFGALVSVSVLTTLASLSQ